jgi:hypothetical protein
MKLSEFKAMWEEDGTKLVKMDEQVRGNEHWYLYNIHFPESRTSYGRHMAVLLQVDRKTREVVAHDTKNTSAPYGKKADPAPWTKEIQDWFQKHVDEGGL